MSALPPFGTLPAFYGPNEPKAIQADERGQLLVTGNSGMSGWMSQSEFKQCLELHHGEPQTPSTTTTAAAKAKPVANASAAKAAAALAAVEACADSLAALRADAKNTAAIRKANDEARTGPAARAAQHAETMSTASGRRANADRYLARIGCATPTRAQLLNLGVLAEDL